MNFDPEELKKLSEGSPDDLSKKIDEVCSMLGIDGNRARKLLGSTEDIQRRLKGMSEADIRRMTKSIDPSVLNKLNKKEE